MEDSKKENKISITDYHKDVNLEINDAYLQEKIKKAFTFIELGQNAFLDKKNALIKSVKELYEFKTKKIIVSDTVRVQKATVIVQKCSNAKVLHSGRIIEDTIDQMSEEEIERISNYIVSLSKY